jgi:hypothetical protein
MLKSIDHDSISGEHVGTTSGFFVTSGKSGIWPLQPLKIRDLESCENSQEGKRPRHFGCWIYGICEEVGCCLVCWGKYYCFLVVMNTTC